MRGKKVALCTLNFPRVTKRRGRRAGPGGRRRPASGRSHGELLAQALGQPGRALRGVVEPDEPAEALGDQPFADVHLEAHLAGRAAYLADPAADLDLLVEGDGRAVVDVALGEDHPELLAADLRGVVGGPQRAHERDPRGFEVAQVDHVVEVAVGVEVAEADALAMDVDRGHAGRGLYGARDPAARPRAPLALAQAQPVRELRPRRGDAVAGLAGGV